MKIVIPTYRRINRQLTYAALSPSRRQDVIFVVRQDEVQEMELLYPDASVLGLPLSISNLLDTRQWIWEKFRNEQFIMADDDIKHFRIRTVDWAKKSGIKSSIISSDEEQNLMFTALQDELNKGAGIVQPGPGWLMPDLQYWPRKSAGNCIQFIAINGPLLGDKVRWDRIKWIEDQDFVLQVLSLGLDAVQLQNYIFYAPLMGVGEGGLNVGLTKQDRAEFERLSHIELAKMWPDYVKPSKKRIGYHTIYRARLLKHSRVI